MQESTSVMQFEIKVTRKTLFYTVVLIVPCIMMGLCSGMVFYLPTAAGEKIGMSIYILLSLVVVLNLLAKILPATSEDVPLLAKYVMVVFVLNVITILVSVIIVNIYFRGPHTHKLPYWVKFIFVKFLARLLMMQRPKHLPVMVSLDPSQQSSSLEYRKLSTYAALKEALAKMKEEESRNIPELHSRGSVSPILGSPLFPVAHHHPHCPQYSQSNSSAPVTPTPSMITTGMPRRPIPTIELATEADQAIFMKEGSVAVVPGLPDIGYKLLKTIEFISDHLKQQEDIRKIREDWKYVSMIVDRILLYVFFGITLGATMGIFFEADNVFKKVDQDVQIRRLSVKYNWPLEYNFMKPAVQSDVTY